MSKVGGWQINVAVGKMPNALATAFGDIFENMIGATYTPIAYLGSQVVHGENHAILAEQKLQNKEGTKNDVLIIINQMGENYSLVSIESIVDGGGQLGGAYIVNETEINADAQKVFDAAVKGLVGNSVAPFVYVGSKVESSINYIYVAEAALAVQDAGKKIVLVTVNGGTSRISFEDILA